MGLGKSKFNLKRSLNEGYMYKIVHVCIGPMGLSRTMTADMTSTWPEFTTKTL